MKRRTFIGLFCASVAALAGASSVFFSTRKEIRYARFTQAVFERLAYLTIDKAELQAFVEDYLTRNEPDKSVDEVARRFLLSTDFFISGMDEEKPVSYLARFDPYSRLCAHPFTVMNYPGISAKESV